MEEKKEKELKLSTIAYAAIFVVLLFLLATGILIYFFGINNRFTGFVSRYVPYPAATVNFTDFVQIKTLQKNLKAIEKFYQSQNFTDTGFRVDFSTEDGKKRLKIKEKNVLNKLIEDIVIRRLAEKRGIKVTSEMVRQEVDRRLNQNQNQDAVLENLQSMYGWNMDDFEQNIVWPGIYKEKLRDSVRRSDPETKRAENKINQALTELEKGVSFADVARKYSEGDSAKNGGAFGWITMDQMIPEIAVTVALLNPGQRTGILESRLGFHIISLDDKKEENGVQSFKISQILVRNRNFADWLMNEEKNFKIYIPLKDYYWEKETQSVQFTDKNMLDFEKNLSTNSANDISVLF